MTKSELKKMKKDELEKLAKKEGVKITSKMSKDEMIEAIAGAAKTPSAKKKDEDVTRKSRKEKSTKVTQPNLENANDTMRGESKKFEIEDKRAYLEPSYELVGEETYELPHAYGENRLMLLVQDPFWVHAYWEITPAAKDEFKVWDGNSLTLRVYNADSGENFDIDLNELTRSWYFNVPKPTAPYYAELGAKSPDGSFKVIVKSNTVNVPTNKPSEYFDEEWKSESEATQEEIFTRSGGYILHKQVGSASFAEWQAQPGLMSSGGSAGSAGGSGSGGVAGRKLPAGGKQRKFWAELHTELIVYGATEPDAKAMVGGVPIKLSPTGTFSIRFYLKDGEHSVPFVATSNDEVETIEITPFVSKHTERIEKINKEF